MELKVVSFNIRNCNDPNGNSVKERAPRLQKVIKPLNADLIGFQEYKQHWAEHIDKYFSKNYDMLTIWRSSNNDEEAVPVLWRKDRFERVDSGCFWLSDTPNVESRGWDEVYNCYRICTYVVLKEKQTQKVFTHINTHFGFGDKGQIASAKLITEFSKKLLSKDVVVTGDFNMRPDSPAYKKMTEFFTDVNAATVGDNTATFHGYAPEQNKDSLIDFCFVTNNIKCKNYKLIDNLVDGKYPSDHYGILAEIEI